MLSTSFHSAAELQIQIQSEVPVFIEGDYDTNQPPISANSTVEFETTLSWKEDKDSCVNNSNMDQREGDMDQQTKLQRTMAGDEAESTGNANTTDKGDAKTINLNRNEATTKTLLDVDNREKVTPLNQDTSKTEGNKSQNGRGKEPDNLNAASKEVEEMEGNISNAQLFKLLSTKIDEMQKDLSEKITAVQQGRNEDQDRIATLEENQKKVTKDLQKVGENKVHQEKQIDAVTDVLSYHGHLIQELIGKVENLQKENMNPNLVIKGLVQKEEKEGGKESCIEVVKNFLSKLLGITEVIKIKKAFRVGKGKTRTMIVMLKNSQDKGKIFAHAKKLQDVKNELGKPYRIENHLPNKMSEKSKKQRNIKYRNQKQTVAENLQLTLLKGKLQVNGQPYQSKIIVPKYCDLLKLKPEEIELLQQQQIHKGRTIEAGTSSFTGYVCDTQTYTEVNAAYEYVRFNNFHARHIICACFLPMVGDDICCDYEEDDEHGAGNQLLEYMVNSDQENRAIFVVREYDGKHIGPQRFDCILDAAKSAVNSKPFNRITQNYQFSWGKGRGGGMAGGRRLLHMDEVASQDSVDSDTEIEFRSSNPPAGDWHTQTMREQLEQQGTITANLTPNGHNNAVTPLPTRPGTSVGSDHDEYIRKTTTKATIT